MKTSKELAEQFMNLSIRGNVTPTENVGFRYDSQAEFMDAVSRRTASLTTKKNLLEMAGLLAQTEISTFFGIHLLNEFYLGHGSPFQADWPIVEAHKMYLGIDLPQEKYGFFDPSRAFDIEDTYFGMQMPYLVLKESHGQMPVSLNDWNMDLHNRRMRKRLG